jgi:exopolysaccharide biosynthesis protein
MELSFKLFIYIWLTLPALTFAQTRPDTLAVSAIEWTCLKVSDGITLKTANPSIFNSNQAIYVADIDTSASCFEFGVAVPDSLMVTSAVAKVENALVAINGTFFNMKEGYNVHYVRVDDSVVAVTDEKEFGVRATGVFTATGENADIAFWGPEREDAVGADAEDAIVSGPLLTDDGEDIALAGNSFNTARHPRSLVGATHDGHILFIVVDGRQPGYADGMSLFELRALARSLGCTDALNLDGGGSSTLYITGHGDNGVVNKPSGKIQRPVPSIVFVRKANH